MPLPVTASTTVTSTDLALARFIVDGLTFPLSFTFSAAVTTVAPLSTVTVPAGGTGTPSTIASPSSLVVPSCFSPLASTIVTLASFTGVVFLFTLFVTLIFTSCVACAIAPTGSSSSAMRNHPMATNILFFILLNASICLISAAFLPRSIPTLCTLSIKSFFLYRLPAPKFRCTQSIILT